MAPVPWLLAWLRDIWPVLGVLAMLLLVADIRSMRHVDDRAAVKASHFGWLFPAGMVATSFFIALFSDDAGTVGLVSIVAPLLAYLGWLIRLSRRHRIATISVAIVVTTQIFATFLALLPAIGLATGFLRVWH